MNFNKWVLVNAEIKALKVIEDGKYLSELRKEWGGITTSWTYVTVGKLEKKGLLESEKVGRVKIVKLTPEGILVKRHIIAIEKLVK